MNSRMSFPVITSNKICCYISACKPKILSLYLQAIQITLPINQLHNYMTTSGSGQWQLCGGDNWLLLLIED